MEEVAMIDTCYGRQLINEKMASGWIKVFGSFFQIRNKYINIIIGLFHLIAIHPHGRPIISSEWSKFMPF